MYSIPSNRFLAISKICFASSTCTYQALTYWTSPAPSWRLRAQVANHTPGVERGTPLSSLAYLPQTHFPRSCLLGLYFREQRKLFLEGWQICTGANLGTKRPSRNANGVIAYFAHTSPPSLLSRLIIRNGGTLVKKYPGGRHQRLQSSRDGGSKQASFRVL